MKFPKEQAEYKIYVLNVNEIENENLKALEYHGQCYLMHLEASLPNKENNIYHKKVTKLNLELSRYLDQGKHHIVSLN